MTTAVLLIGFQNEYFHEDGLLHEVPEDRVRMNSVLVNTLELVMKLPPSMPVISIPIIFTRDYAELHEPVGVLARIMEVGAFQQGTVGSRTIQEICELGTRVEHVPGKRGLDAFTGTDLASKLRRLGVTHTAIAGVITSLCIDSTARAAHAAGFSVTILTDCICGMTRLETDFYCGQIFPLYASLSTASAFAHASLDV